MNLKKSNVFWATGLMLVATWILGSGQSNISLDLSIFSAKVSLTLLAVWLCLDKEKS